MSKKEILYLLLVLSAGATMGIFGLIFFPKIPVNSDAISYFTAARNLLGGKGLVISLSTPTMAYFMGVPHPDYHMPGWPLLLAGFMWLTKTGPCTPIILNIALALGSSALAYFTLLLWSDSEKAFWGALLFMLFPSIMVYQFTGMAEMPLLFWLMLSVFTASLPRAGRTIALLIGIGIILIFAYATRETALFFLPLILSLLRERGARWSTLTILTLIILAASLILSYLYYSLWPGFSETSYVFNQHGILFKTGTITPEHNPMWNVVRPEDFPKLSLPELFWLLLKKPLRLLLILPRNKSWETIAADVWTLGAIILAPIIVKGWKMRLGLGFLVLIVPAMFTLYYPKTDYLMRIGLVFGSVAVVFIAARLRLTRISRFLICMALACELTIGALCSWNLQKTSREGLRKMQEIYPVLKENLPPDARIVGIRGFSLELLPVYEPDIYTVLYPDRAEHARMLSERIGTDALVFASGQKPYPGLEDEGWYTKALTAGGDSLFICTKRK
ncbi:MAG: hypothetical protein ABIN54_05005 [candidate division WOR-3 bacterium]